MKILSVFALACLFSANVFATEEVAAEEAVVEDQCLSDDAVTALTDGGYTCAATVDADGNDVEGSTSCSQEGEDDVVLTSAACEATEEAAAEETATE